MGRNSQTSILSAAGIVIAINTRNKLFCDPHLTSVDGGRMFSYCTQLLLITCGIEADMFDPDGLIIIQKVRGMIGNVLIMEQLIDSAIGINNVVNTDLTGGILENLQIIL
jgi:hypothetical protein